MTPSQIQKLKEEREELRHLLEKVTRVIWAIEKGFCWVCGSRSSRGHLCLACESAGYDPDKPVEILKTPKTYWHRACPYYLGAYISSHVFVQIVNWRQGLLVSVLVISLIHLLVSYKMREARHNAL